MNKIFKLMFTALVGILALASCTNSDDYEMAAKLSGEQVYFPNTLSSTVNLKSTEISYTIPVMRVNSSGEVTVPLTVEYAGEAMTIPTSVTFKDGQTETSLTIAYDADKLGFDNFEKVTLKIGNDDYTTIYGASSFTCSFGIPAPWTSLGKCTFIENYMFGIEKECAIYQNDIDNSLYRIENAFNPSGPNASPWLYVKILKKGDVVLDETIPEDGYVYFYGGGANANEFNTGVENTNYGADVCLVFPGTFTSMPDPSFWTHNKVTGWKEDGTPGSVQLAPMYYMFGVGGWNQSQADDIINIILPGFVVVDYSAEIEAVGRLIDKKENGQAVFDITLGADVASAKVAMAPGKGAEEAAYKLILDEDPSVVEITSSQEVRIPYEEPGDYTVIVVTYDADGNEQKYATATIYIPENGAPKEIFEALFTGIYSHCVKSLDGEGPMWDGYDPEEGMLYVSNLDEDRCMISPWVNLGYEEEGTEGEGMIFLWDEEDNITVPECFTGVTNSKYGDIWAWDLVTAQVEGAEDMASYYDEKTGIINFFLAWSCSAGHFSFTHDTFELTGYADAGAKKKAAKHNKGVFTKKSCNFKLPLVNNGVRKVKAHKSLTFKSAPSKNLKIKK